MLNDLWKREVFKMEEISSEIKSEVYNYVYGSCNPDLSWVAEQLGVDDSDVEDALLDLNLELCTMCGWWADCSEMDNIDGEAICSDCQDKYDDE